jgi:hypothetical protein
MKITDDLNVKIKIKHVPFLTFADCGYCQLLLLLRKVISDLPLVLTLFQHFLHLRNMDHGGCVWIVKPLIRLQSSIGFLFLDLMTCWTDLLVQRCSPSWI